jgi:hypothetical protein
MQEADKSSLVFLSLIEVFWVPFVAMAQIMDMITVARIYQEKLWKEDNTLPPFFFHQQFQKKENQITSKNEIKTFIASEIIFHFFNQGQLFFRLFLSFYLDCAHDIF